jgi:hypothetical protein
MNNYNINSRTNDLNIINYNNSNKKNKNEISITNNDEESQITIEKEKVVKESKDNIE